LSVAEAFVTVRPEMNRFGGELNTGLVGSLGAAGGVITGAMSRAFKVAGLAAGAVAGAAVWGGLQRALDTEDATVTFRRLGLDQASIDGLTSGIDEALSGTTVANPEGFALAGRFLASGFDEADIPGIVGTLADMAQVGNREFSEMADVMVRAAGQGRITAAELNRMGDIPFGRIAEEMGMTEAQMRGLASEGGLTAEAFLTAFEAVEEFNGAAKDPTTRQAFANLRTAVSRMGEAFIGPLLGEGGAAHRALLAIRESVENVIPRVRDLGEAFAAWLIPAIQDRLIPAFQRLGDFFTETIIPAFERMRDFVDQNRETIDKLAAAIAPAIGIVAGLSVAVHLLAVAFKVLALATPLGIILALATGLIYAWQNSETFRDVVIGAFEAVQEFLAPIIARVVGWVEGFGESNSEVGNQLRDIWAQAQDTFAAAFEYITAVITRFVEWAEGYWQEHGDEIIAIMGIAWDTIAGVIEGALGIIEGLFQTGTAIIEGDWSKFWDGLESIASGTGTAIESIVTGLLDTLLVKFGTSTAEISAVVLAEMIILIGHFRALPERITTALGDLSGLLVQAGKDIVSGLISGIGDMGGRAASAIRGVVDGAIDSAKRRLGINSPSKVFMQIGEQTTEGLLQGLMRDSDKVAMASLGGMNIPEFQRMQTPAFATQGAPQQAAPIHLHVHGSLIHERELSDLVGKKLAEFNRRNGRN
jgi:tape measure domain-containing protein